MRLSCVPTVRAVGALETSDEFELSRAVRETLDAFRADTAATRALHSIRGDGGVLPHKAAQTTAKVTAVSRILCVNVPVTAEGTAIRLPLVVHPA